MDVTVVIGLVVGAVVAAGIVLAFMARGRQALAVTESKLAGVTTDLASARESERKLGEEKFALTGERERLKTSLENANEDRDRAVALATQLRLDLDASRVRNGDLETNYRVAKARGDGLTEQVTQLEARVQSAEQANQGLTVQVAQLGADVSALRTERDGLSVRLQEQKAWIKEQTEAMEARVTATTDRLLEDKARKFTELNKTELGTVVNPFNEKLTEFRNRVDAIHTQESKDRGELKQQIVQLTDLNQTVSQRAEDLTNALTITSKSTGDWGETILQKILEGSGLREGKEYSLQYPITGLEGERLQPDAVVFLPENRQVVVDSKVSNKAWTEYCAATDEVTREQHLANHLASLRAHIKGLSAKDYERSPDLHTVDFVLMFVPVEGALLTAFTHDDSLYSDAYKSKIILVTPSTLMAVLKLIEGIWLYQRRKESADKIAEAGRKLFEKLTTFSETFVEVGEAIEKAHGTFEKARGQLATGKGNAIRLAQRMVELGVGPAPGKVIAPELLALTDTEEGTDESDVPTLAVVTEMPGEV